MNIITWIVLGGLAGWLASLVMRTDEQQGMGMNILVGMVGAIIGGALSNIVGGPSVSGLNLRSMVVAVVGSIVVIGFVRLIQRRPSQY